MVIGKSIELYLADGTPGGITTAQISGSAGKFTSARRTQLQQLFNREEASFNGAYVLLGNDPAAIENTWCYIGRTENFMGRLRTHDQRKPQWERVIIIYSADPSFNEGHWGYLEARLLDLAKQANRCTLDDNKQTPHGRKLSEAQEATAESFLEEIKLVLPVLGVNILRSSEMPQPQQVRVPEESPVFVLDKPNSGISARMREVDGEFFLLKDSRITSRWEARGKTESTKRSYAALSSQYEKLISDGSIKIVDGVGLVTRDIPFVSPSTAAAVSLGRSSNGRVEWKTEDGRTYADWEDSQTA